VQELIDRQIRESRTLDYKATLKLDDSGKQDLLEDVSAMANAAGGTILYGAIEGKGEDSALIVRYEGIQLEPDAVGLQVSNLLRDGIEERLPHVLHRAIPVPGGGYLYVIRIPPSPRAPHMVTRRSSRDRFFLRGNISNDPMRIEQIREAFVRSDSMVDRARHFIQSRTEATLDFIASRPKREKPLVNEDTAALLHAIPLYQATDVSDLGDERIAMRMKQVRGYGSSYEGNLRWTLEGLYTQNDSDGVHRKDWALLTRNGAFEFGAVEALDVNRSHEGEGTRVLDIWHLDREVLGSIEQVRQLARDHWISAPFVLSFRLLNVQSAFLVNHRNFGDAVGRTRQYAAKHLIVEPEIVTDMDAGLDTAVRHIFDTVWQAFGAPRCMFYETDSKRKALNES